MKRILVTGGTGFLGSSLTRLLVQKGYDVTVFDNEFRGAIDRLHDIKKDFTFIKGDIRESNKVIKACKNKDSIIHLAYVNGTELFYKQPELVLDVGVKGMVNILDGCKKHDVSELFLASSSEVYNQPNIVPTPEDIPMIIPDPKNPRFSYAGGKIISELLTLHFGKKYLKRAVIFRPHNVYGPDMGFEHVIPQFILRMRKLMKKEGNSFAFPIQGSGKETRTFIYIDDFINGLYTVFKKGKHLEIYNIGTMDEIAIAKLAKTISKLLRVSIQIKPSELLQGSTTRRCGNIQKIKKLGFHPQISLEEGLEKTIAWYSQTRI